MAGALSSVFFSEMGVGRLVETDGDNRRGSRGAVRDM